MAVLGCLGLDQHLSWNLHLQISTQLRWLSSRTGSDGDEDGRRGELSVDCLFHPHRRFRIQKPGSYITPCSQAFATTIASLGYSLWSGLRLRSVLDIRSICRKQFEDGVINTEFPGRSVRAVGRPNGVSKSRVDIGNGFISINY